MMARSLAPPVRRADGDAGRAVGGEIRVARLPRRAGRADVEGVEEIAGEIETVDGIGTEDSREAGRPWRAAREIRVAAIQELRSGVEAVAIRIGILVLQDIPKAGEFPIVRQRVAVEVGVRELDGADVRR